MRKSQSGYYTNRHSCFLLQYHLVLVTKYRRPVLVEELETALIFYARDYFAKQGCCLLEISGNADHMHFLFEAPPQINLADFVNAFKSASSRKMRKQFPAFLATYYWEPHFWSLSYFVGTVSNRTTEAVSKYIQKQKD